MKNIVHTIYPYEHNRIWVFDDVAVGLVREPFVSGADKIIELMTADILDAASGFSLVFSEFPFPGHQEAFKKRREQGGGYWYYSPGLDLEGWLCPALFHYFELAPDTLYTRCKESTENLESSG